MFSYVFVNEVEDLIDLQCFNNNKKKGRESHAAALLLERFVHTPHHDQFYQPHHGLFEECRSKDKTISKLQDVIHEERHKSETKDTGVDNLTSEVFRVWEIIDDTRSKLEAKTRLADELEREVKILQLKIEELELESRRLKDMVKDTQHMQGNGGQE